MRLLRRRPPPRAATLRPALRYLEAASTEAQLLGHDYVGTEHVLLALTRGAELARLGVSPEAVRATLFGKLVSSPRPPMDADALATLGIDLDEVRRRIEATFGPGALERAGGGCTSVSPRLKQALAHAVDEAGEEPVGDRHVLVGLVTVEECLAALVLAEHGVTAARLR